MGRATRLGNQGALLIWIIHVVGEVYTVIAVSVGDIFLVYHILFLSSTKGDVLV